ncbi:MAG: phosphate ABC transporter substrate-binding protein PstS family protein [Erysipelotrichaceae bacterium]|nr:phosphate ABC transporter substrate-binding protein PstS family protein [Erysipelotrichaceae bacterium]
MKKLLTVLLAVLMVLGLSACSNNSAADRNTDKENNQIETLSGKLSLSGSTSMEKVCEALAETFMEEYPDVTVTVEYTGSGAGIESVTNKMVDIGNSSRALKDTEKEKGVVENVIAIDGIAVITNNSNEVENLTKEDLIKIYTGEIKNWKELGGKDENIVVLGREAGSGTRGAFEELLGIVDSCVYAGELDSTGGVKAKVASTEGTIGYVSLDVVDDTVKALKLDGVEATEANIKAGSYLLSRPFVMATNGEISAQNEIVQTWFDYIKSAEGQEVIKSVGLILPD